MGLKIYVVQAGADGVTELDAFDAALYSAGIANQNLVYLSSIIPEQSVIVEAEPPYTREQFGNRLYCVMAQHRTSQIDSEAWAGIGWTQDTESGRGLFAEANGTSEEEVQSALFSTLNAMAARRPYVNWEAPHLKVSGICCRDRPVCSLVAATYASIGWSGSGQSH